MPSNTLSLLRFALGIIATLLVQHGLLSADQTTSFVTEGAGALTALGAVVWIVYKNAHTVATIKTAALTANPNPTSSDVAAVKAGAVADLSSINPIPSVPPALAILCAIVSLAILAGCTTAQQQKVAAAEDAISASVNNACSLSAPTRALLGAIMPGNVILMSLDAGCSFDGQVQMSINDKLAVTPTNSGTSGVWVLNTTKELAAQAGVPAPTLSP